MRVRSILGAVLAALLLLAACGGDSGDPESLASDQQQDDDSNSDDSDGSDSGDSDSDIDLPDSDDLDDIPDVFGGDCLEFALAYSTVFLGGAAALFGSDEDVADMQSELDDLGGSVPSDIADEFDTVTEAYNEFFEAVGDEGLFGAGDIPAPEDDPDVVEAQATIDAWLADNCDGF